MKKIFALLLLCLVFVTAGAQHTYVLLAGVSNYNDPDVSNLTSTTKDVKSLRRVFERQEATTVKAVTGKYATRENIAKLLNVFVKYAGPDDKIVFFFSGHGTTGAFVPYGRDRYAYADLITLLSSAATKNVFCFIDAYMTGSAAGAVSDTYGWGSGNKVTFCMSSRADEVSAESGILGHGYFTQALIKGLRAQADSNDDRNVTLLELFRYVHADVVERTKATEHPQHPQLIGPKEMYGTVITRW